ncbi:hypothetical protein ACFLYR_00940 [Chloroflexota bacterium]
MEYSVVKVKIAVLWFFMSIDYSAHMALSIFEPGVIELVCPRGKYCPPSFAELVVK